jgi:hypothetical protein
VTIFESLFTNSSLTNLSNFSNTPVSGWWIISNPAISAQAMPKVGLPNSVTDTAARHTIYAASGHARIEEDAGFATKEQWVQEAAKKKTEKDYRLELWRALRDREHRETAAEYHRESDGSRKRLEKARREQAELKKQQAAMKSVAPLSISKRYTTKTTNSLYRGNSYPVSVHAGESGGTAAHQTKSPYGQQGHELWFWLWILFHGSMLESWMWAFFSVILQEQNEMIRN